jgi:hypothetical protein
MKISDFIKNTQGWEKLDFINNVFDENKFVSYLSRDMGIQLIVSFAKNGSFFYIHVSLRHIGNKPLVYKSQEEWNMKIRENAPLILDQFFPDRKFFQDSDQDGTIHFISALEQ